MRGPRVSLRRVRSGYFAWEVRCAACGPISNVVQRWEAVEIKSAHELGCPRRPPRNDHWRR